MGHKADRSFFDQKKEWSKRKDLILDYYLPPYLAKVARLRRPILLVDGFAGPGQFGDQSLGSPLIMCKNAAPIRNISVSVLCIEQDEILHDQLAVNVAKYPFARTRHGRFLDILPEIEAAARTHTIFLYLDPYAIEGIDWTSLDRVFKHVDRGSIEVLLNFFGAAFARRARSALTLRQTDMPGISEVDEDLSSILTLSGSHLERLNRVVGGDWWQAIVKQQHGFEEEVTEITDHFCGMLASRFREVCKHAVKEHWNSAVPKYTLIFGSRSPDAFKLMNDAAAKSRKQFAEAESPAEGRLFEMLPLELVPEPSRLPKLVVDQVAGGRLSRGEVIVKVMRNCFGDYTETQIRQAIAAQIKMGVLASETGRSRINDGELIWRITAK